MKKLADLGSLKPKISGSPKFRTDERGHEL